MLESRGLYLPENLLIDVLQLLFKKSHVFHTKSNDASVMIGHPMALQGFGDCRDLLPRGTACQFSYLPGGGFPFQQRLQHELTRSSEHIGEDGAQFDVAVLQNFLYPITLAAGVAQNAL